MHTIGWWAATLLLVLAMGVMFGALVKVLFPCDCTGPEHLTITETRTA
jgi:hypothetical protein